MNMKRKSLLRLTCSLLVLVSSGSFAIAQPVKLNAGYGGISGDQLPAWVAKEAGIFQKNGLDVQLIYFTGGTTAVMALISAETPISQVGGSAIVNSVLAGSDAVIVAGGLTSLNNYWLMGRADIKAPEQLRGGSVAISRFGSASDFVARYALGKIGLTPGKDVTLVQIGATPTRMDAILTGRVHATVLAPPAAFIALKRGMTLLADPAKLGLIVQHISVATTRKFIREKPDIVRRYVKSQVEAVHRIYTDKETSLRTLSKYFGRGVEHDILEMTWEGLLSESILPKKQYAALEGIQTILAPLAEKDPKAKAAKPEEFVDSSFIKELDQSGYIDGLYKRK